jgi:hypothetical protein
MEKDLKNKLLKHIKDKTVYFEELKMGNTFLKAGWDVQHSNYYLDRDEEKGREIDISARKSIVFKNSSKEEYWLELRLVCEVKKSVKNHWIIFSTKKSHYEDWLGFALYYKYGIENALETKIKAGVGRSSSIDEFSRIGITYYEAFNDHSQIFKALTSSTKASEYFLTIRENAMRKKNYLAIYPKTIEFIEPTVIFNGLMYEAYFNEKNKLELNEINHIPVLFNYISPNYNRSNYLIDVVTTKELPKLLASKEKWINAIKKIMQE